MTVISGPVPPDRMPAWIQRSADEPARDLVDDAGQQVGYLWVGPSGAGDPGQWWVWDVVVDEASRRKGHGRAAMRLAEEYAAAAGATSLGLSVIGFNAGARALYESLGYETTSVKMAKRLEPPV